MSLRTIVVPFVLGGPDDAYLLLRQATRAGTWVRHRCDFSRSTAFCIERLDFSDTTIIILTTSFGSWVGYLAATMVLHERRSRARC